MRAGLASLQLYPLQPPLFAGRYTLVQPGYQLELFSSENLKPRQVRVGSNFETRLLDYTSGNSPLPARSAELG